MGRWDQLKKYDRECTLIFSVEQQRKNVFEFKSMN